MTSEQISLRTWAPHERQSHLAEYLAAGYSLRRACIITNIPYTTAYEWWGPNGIAEYHDYVRKLREQHVASYQNRFSAIVSLALDIELQVLTGELDADSPVAVRAHAILSRTGYRIAALRAVGGGADPKLEPRTNPGLIPGPAA